MLPRQVVSFNDLIDEGLTSPQIKKLSASLKIFPTPFKGIYYVPSPEERNGWFIDKPLFVLKKALWVFLNGGFYFGCSTAEEFFGIKWTPSNQIHIVNQKKSGSINLRKRVKQNERKRTFRAKKIAFLLSLYGNVLIFHKIKNIKNAKIKETPYGIFATKSQIKKDRKRFHRIKR